MEEYHQITISEYLSWKQEIKDRLNTTVDNFIAIGYRLKQIRDSEAYRNDGYSSMGDFVRAEYNLNEATASKFIKINDVYSEGGNSMFLQTKYKGYGYNKLYEMIALPQSDRDLITADTSVKEIRELKQFNKEADQAAEPPAVDADEEKLLTNLLQTNQEAFDWIMSNQEKDHMEDILYSFAPSGSRMIRQGTLMLFLLSEQEGVKIKRFGAGQQQMRYAEFFDRIREVFAGRESEIFPEMKADIELPEESETSMESRKLDNFDIEKEASEESEEESKNVIKPDENVIKEPEDAQEKPENVQESAKSAQEEEKTEEILEAEPSKEFAMNEPEEEARQQESEMVQESTEMPEEETMSRYEYLRTLTEFGMATYLYKHLPRTSLSAPNAKDLRVWLQETVDEKGRRYSS